MTAETAFTVLARAKELIAGGKDVVELEIGDSPFPAPQAAKAAAIAAVEGDRSHYCPSSGLPELRRTVAEVYNRDYGVNIGPENVIVGPGAKNFEVLFCEALVEPGDGVLVFSPYFPTYLPNIARRGGRIHLAPLRQEKEFRPDLADVANWLANDPKPRAIFLNSPHNPTGGVATEEDLRGLAELIAGRDVAVFSDEPYEQMVWRGQHHSLLAMPGMLQHTVAAYTFSKSYSMSGYRIGYAITQADLAAVLGTLINTSLSCVPPVMQLAAAAALSDPSAAEHRDRTMQLFRQKVEILVEGLNQIEGVHCLDPGGTFYVFPKVTPICNQLGLTSHGLAMFLLEDADAHFGVACLGGECFGEAGAGFLRLSCAEPNDRLQKALDFLPQAFARKEAAAEFLQQHPQHRLTTPYPE